MIGHKLSLTQGTTRKRPNRPKKRSQAPQLNSCFARVHQSNKTGRTPNSEEKGGNSSEGRKDGGGKKKSQQREYSPITPLVLRRILSAKVLLKCEGGQQRYLACTSGVSCENQNKKGERESEKRETTGEQAKGEKENKGRRSKTDTRQKKTGNPAETWAPPFILFLIARKRGSQPVEYSPTPYYAARQEVQARATRWPPMV